MCWSKRAAAVRQIVDPLDVREHSGDFPDRAEEWEIYLESIRDYAGPDGRLPASLDWLIWDTFGDVLERRGTSLRTDPS